MFVQPIVIQPCQMLLPTDSVSDTAGSTIAQTLQGLISPGSTVYASATAVESSATSSESGQSFQMSASATSQLSIPPPVAILAPVDQQGPTQQPALGVSTSQGDGSSTTTAAVPFNSRPQQAVCQLVQPSPQGLESTSLQGVMGPAGTQVISTENGVAQSQVVSKLC